MSLTLIIAIIGIGAVLFGGYIFYSISSHKSGSTASSVSTETKEELELISKMQKQQLIKDQKQIQDLEAYIEERIKAYVSIEQFVTSTALETILQKIRSER